MDMRSFIVLLELAYSYNQKKMIDMCKLQLIQSAKSDQLSDMINDIANNANISLVSLGFVEDKGKISRKKCASDEKGWDSVDDYKKNVLNFAAMLKGQYLRKPGAEMPVK